MSKWEIDNWIDECALKPIKYFSPTAIQKDLGMDINYIFDRLMILVNDEKLKLSWRIVCPICFRQLDICNNTDSIPRYINCWECGEIEVTRDMVYPLFRIDDEYKQEVINQKKTQGGNYPLLFSRRKRTRILCH